MNFSKKKNKNTALNLIKKRKIKILLKEQKNNECFECSKLNPEYISLNNAIFLCHHCVKQHLKFPKVISNIIKNNLHNLTLKNIQYLCCGGNQKLNEFINTEYPNLKKISPIKLYQTYAMDYYRKLLEYLIEGGIKPTKPEKEKAYEFLVENNEDNLPKNKKKYPKIKPIVGSKNSFRYTHNISRYNNSLDLSTIGNFNNSLDLENINSTTCCNYNYNYSNNKGNDFKKKFFLSQFNDDLNNDEINNITDINEVRQFNKEENDNKNENLKTITNSNKKKIFLDTNIKVFRSNNMTQTINNSNINNNTYSKPIYQNVLNTSNQENYLFRKIRNKNENNEKHHKVVNSIDNPGNYISIKNRKNKNFLLNSNDSTEQQNININNINDNIIINKNLNIFYNNNNNKNNNSVHRIFKKKAIGNSFSINDNNKKHKLNSINNSIDKNAFFMNTTLENEDKNEKKIFLIKKNFKNDIKKKLLDNPEENTNNTFIEKIKVNRQLKPTKKSNNFNNIMTESNKYDNEYINNEAQKSRIIQRISRVLRTQKEKEKKKSTEIIKVNQKEINIIKNNNLLFYDKTPKGGISNTNDNTPKTDATNECKKRYTLSIKEIINVPSLSKKKNFIDIIKSNNLCDKIISPSARKVLQINTDPKKYQKKDLIPKSQLMKFINSKRDYDKK